MAFYSVRVDDDGKEIETTRRTSQTFRKILLDKSKSIDNNNNNKGNNFMKNDQKEFQEDNHSPIMKNTYKTVRYNLYFFLFLL